jgi:hypothetical protein
VARRRHRWPVPDRRRPLDADQCRDGPQSGLRAHIYWRGCCSWDSVAICWCAP